MRLRLMKTNLLKRIYSILLVLCLFLSVFSSGIVVKAGDGSGTGNGDNDGIHGDGDSSFDTGITVYRVSFHIEKYPLEDNLLKEGVESGKFVGDDSAGFFKYDTFWYRCELLNAQNYEEGTQLSLAAGESNFSHIINKNIESNQCFYIVDDSNGFKVNDNNMSGSAAKNFCNRESFGSMKVALNSSGAWHSLGKNDYKVAKFSDFKGKSIFGNISSMDDLLNVFNTDINVGFNAFNRPEDKLSAYETVCGIGGLDTSLLADFENKGIVIVEKCFAVSRKENGYRNWQVVSWGSLLANNVATFGEGSHSNLIGMSDSSYIKSAKPGDTMPKNINKVGRFYLFQYSPLIKEGNLKPNKGAAEAYQICSGFGIWGFTAAGGAGTATNTLAVYNADPVTGGTADPTKWEIYSTIVDGKMPDTPDGTCEDLKFWNKTDWKSASKFLEAIDGSTSDTLQNIDNGEYAMIARDSYRNVAVPAYKSVLMSGVVANNDKAQDAAKLLEKAPENVVWGAKTVSELTGNADSFGNVITIATLNGMPFGNNTSGYAQTANGLQMVGGVRKAGTLTNDPILEQVNNEIKNAFTQSSSGNWTGTGVGTHFTTDTSALGSAVEIVVKGKPVESDLHVVSVFDGVATLTPNVKNYKYTTVNYGIVDPQIDSGVSDSVQAVILVPKDGTPTGDSITSSMQGTTPDNAISTFIGLSEDSREGAPIINVGNKDDKGYLIPSYNLMRLSSNDKYMVSAIDYADVKANGANVNHQIDNFLYESKI